MGKVVRMDQAMLILFALIGCCLSLIPVPTAKAATPAEIQTAIDKGKAYLYKTQKSGNWEVVQVPDPKIDYGYDVENTQFGGLTAVATFALLAAGEDPQDPRLKQAIAFLKKTDSHGIYALGMRCQIWNMIPQDESVKQVLRHDRDLLIKGIAGKQPNTGFYGYDATKPGSDADHSSSQFGVLGLWAIDQAGVEVPTPVWNAFDAGWRAHQLADGGWTYRQGPDAVSLLSMTAAGAATLFITQDYTHFAPRLNGNIKDPAIDAALKWMGEHLPEVTTRREYYTLFGVSRVGLACGYKYIGNTNWFAWGSDLIVHSQAAEGFWSGGLQNDNNVPDTSFSLLFLSRSRAPIVFNKLNYDVVAPGNKSNPGSWNQRPRDVANLTRMIGKQIESQLNWQVVTLKQTAQDLQEAPILYMSGSSAPKLSTQDQQTVKQFIENGGLVFGHADGSSLAFAEGFRKLGEAMFPGRTFAPLPAGHPIYVAENFPRTTWSLKPNLEGLNNGDRELMLLLPAGDPAKAWQSQAFPNIKKDIFGQLMINIVLYASDQENLRERGQTYLLTKDDSIHATKSLKVARLQYAGNWDPEPGGWRRLAIAMHNDRKLDVDVQPIDPASGKLDKSFAAADLVVNGPIPLTDPAIKAIHDYVTNGGTLVVNAAGGAGIDRTTAEAELAKIFPEAPKPLPPLTPDNKVYAAGYPIKDVEYRHYARTMLGSSHAPRLRGWIINNRVAIIYSPDDLSTGLVGQPVGGILGYAPQSATRLMENVLTYAANH